MELNFNWLIQHFLCALQIIAAIVVFAEGEHLHKRFLVRRQILAGRPPEILPDPENITVHRNEQVVLKCRVINRGTKSVQWNLKDSSHILSIGALLWTPDKDFRISYMKHNDSCESWDLIIKNAQPRHSNVYECQISSKNSNRRYVYLTVLDSIRRITPGIILTGNTVLDSKETIRLTCNATGAERPPLGVDWYHDGKIIKENEKQWRGRTKIISFRSDQSSRSLISQLAVEKSTLNDHGTYICRSADRETESIDVSILDDGTPPSRPARNKELSAKQNRAALSTMNLAIFSLAFLISRS